MIRASRLLPIESLKRLFLVAIAVGSMGLIGCGTSPFSSLGPQEPLLPALEGEAKFSDRFQLEEIPQFFYDLFGKELLEGNEVHQYIEEKRFDNRGNLVQGWSGQLDSNRFVLQLDREILTEETFRGRHAEAAIGNFLRIKPETLFPAGYIMRKTEFDGHRFDLSFAHERHLFTLLNSRISNTILIPQTAAGGTLAPSLGRRTSTEDSAFLANAHLIGFRAQGLIGDVFRIGVTYLNLRQEFHQRIDNPFLGSVPNVPPEVVVLTFRDDSPEDGRVGAAFQSMDIVITYQEQIFDVEIITEDPTTGDPLEQPRIIRTPQETQEQVLTWTVNATDMLEGNLSGAVLDGGEPDVTVTTLLPSEDPRITRSVRDVSAQYPMLNGWRVANGFDAFHYVVNLANLPDAAAAQLGGSLLNPHVVKSIAFTNLRVAGDYNIVMNGYSSGNIGDEEGPLLGMNDAGLIQMPYRDVVQANGNIGQEDTDIDVTNPEEWDPKTLGTLQYGAARSATLVGFDLEGSIGNVLIRAQYSVNNKYKKYPTVNQDSIDFTLLEQDSGLADTTGGTASDFRADEPSQGRTFAANNGEEFKFEPAGPDNDSSEVAWFVQLQHRLGRILFKESFYHIDPGYTTNYQGWGSNTDRDETYSIEDTPESQDQSPFDEDNYMLVEDDDDNDDWPDSNDFDGVLPQADDRDQNDILDFQEDFLIFDADPPIFDDLIDLDNNGVIDSLEDDFEPDYEFGIDREGYHIAVDWDIFDNMTMTFGWLNESEVSSARRNNSKYLHFDFQRDIAELGTFRLQNRLRIVEDDIPDYAITLRFGALDVEALADQLDFFHATENSTTMQLLYNAINNLTLELKYLLTLGRQSPPDEERVIFADDPDTPELDERIDLMVPIQQVDVSGDLRNYPFYPDPNLIFDITNWQGRRYGVRRFTNDEGDLVVEEGKNIRQQLAIFKARYEIPLAEISALTSFIEKIGEDMVITPIYKYIFELNTDRGKEELFTSSVKFGTFEKGTRFALDPINVDPGDAESLEYLRFNRNSREIVEGVRFDYQFTQTVQILAGFQYRKFVNKDRDYFRYLSVVPDGFLNAPILYRPDSRTRIFELQIIQQGLWAGFNVVVLSGFRVRKDVLRNVDSNTTFVRAMVGF